MKQILLSFLLVIPIANLFGYNQLTVGDPRNSWYTYQGTIEEASLSVRPEGLFMEYGLNLTFSSRGTNWTSVNDSLEVILRFDLPANAIVHDSWLWMGKDTVKAIIMDKWSASSIYESIVKRRRDPSILTKLSATQYELRVFPMAGNETRKVKITYLMPASWSKTNVLANLPTAILNTSKYLPAKFPIYTRTDTEWPNPQIINGTDLKFTAKSDSTSGDYLEVDIPSVQFKNSINIGFDSPVKNGIYFSKYQQGNDGIYQFALFPSAFLDSTAARKAAILVDYDASNTTITSNELLNVVKNEMLLNLTSRDSFNLLFSNLSIKRYSNKWISASKTNIEAAFNSLNNPLSSYSNIATLLENGIDFVKSNGNNGKIILISDADQYGDYKVANTLINDISAIMNPKIPIHISDYQSINFQYFYINGLNYYGNEYFYTNLSRIALGSYHNVRSGLPIAEAIDGSFKYLSGSINSFDLHTSLDQGFCYGRYTITGETNVAYLNDPILQVGKFKGEFPFIVEISGEYNSKIFSRKIEIQNPEGVGNDTISEEIWTGQYIKKLETDQQSNDIINEIIYNSLNDRVLSKYTAFLCIEDSSQVCTNCPFVNDAVITGSEKLNAGQDLILAYPNPFTDKLTIDVNCSDANAVKELSIYDMKGSLIYQFTVGQLHKGKNVLTWNGISLSGEKVKPGVYILSYKTNSGTKILKILRK